MLQSISVFSRPNVSTATIDDRPSGDRSRAKSTREDEADRVDLSETAVRQSADAKAPRTNLIDSIRARIAAGTYLTDDKIDHTVDRIMDEVLHR